MSINCVIDAHVWISSLSSRSPFHWVVESLLDEKFDLYISHDILLEYEEKLKEHYSLSIAENFLRALKELPNVHLVDVFFQWQILDTTDPDDNKFVDAAFAANVHYLVSDDKHYKPLDNSNFPKINRIRLEEFRKILEGIE
jgi:uncharacterized protein